MSNIADFTGLNRSLDELSALSGGPKGPHDGDGGNMLEARVKHLEDDMREVKSDLKALRSDVAELKGRVSMLPGWPGLLTIAGFIVAAVGLMIRFLPSAG